MLPSVRNVFSKMRLCLNRNSSSSNGFNSFFLLATLTLEALVEMNAAELENATLSVEVFTNMDPAELENAAKCTIRNVTALRECNDALREYYLVQFWREMKNVPKVRPSDVKAFREALQEEAAMQLTKAHRVMNEELCRKTKKYEKLQQRTEFDQPESSELEVGNPPKAGHLNEEYGKKEFWKALEKAAKQSKKVKVKAEKSNPKLAKFVPRIESQVSTVVSRVTKLLQHGAGNPDETKILDDFFVFKRSVETKATGSNDDDSCDRHLRNVLANLIKLNYCFVKPLRFLNTDETIHVFEQCLRNKTKDQFPTGDQFPTDMFTMSDLDKNPWLCSLHYLNQKHLTLEGFAKIRDSEASFVLLLEMLPEYARAQSNEKWVDKFKDVLEPGIMHIYDEMISSMKVEEVQKLFRGQVRSPSKRFKLEVAKQPVDLFDFWGRFLTGRGAPGRIVDDFPYIRSPIRVPDEKSTDPSCKEPHCTAESN